MTPVSDYLGHQVSYDITTTRYSLRYSFDLEILTFWNIEF